MVFRRPMPADAVDDYTRGLASYRKGQYVEAVRRLGGLRGQKGMVGTIATYYHALSHRQLGLEAMSTGDYPAAEAHFREARGGIGRESDLAGYLAKLYARGGRFECCQRQTDLAREQAPDDPETWRRHALAQWRAGRRIEALMTVTEGLRRLGDDPGLLVQMGLFHAGQEQFEAAKASLERAVAANQGWGEAHGYLGLVALSLREPAAAVRSFQRAFELCPGDLVLAHNLALAAKAAQENGLKVVIRLPDSSAPPADSHVLQLAEYVAAEPDFLSAILATPPSLADDQVFGILDRVVTVSLEAHPSYADLHFRRSEIFQRLDRPQESIVSARQALQINPNYLQARVHLGKLLATVGRHRQAARELNKAVAAGADWPDVHYSLADVLAAEGRTNQARDHLQKALKLNAGYRSAADALGKLAA